MKFLKIEDGGHTPYWKILATTQQAIPDFSEILREEAVFRRMSAMKQIGYPCSTERIFLFS